MAVAPAGASSTQAMPPGDFAPPEKKRHRSRKRKDKTSRSDSAEPVTKKSKKKKSKSAPIAEPSASVSDHEPEPNVTNEVRKRKRRSKADPSPSPEQKLADRAVRQIAPLKPRPKGRPTPRSDEADAGANGEATNVAQQRARLDSLLTSLGSRKKELSPPPRIKEPSPPPSLQEKETEDLFDILMESASVTKPVHAASPKSTKETVSEPHVDDNVKACQPRNDKQEALKKWLEGLDSGRGALVTYFDVIKDEFDCDFGQLSAVKLSNPETPGLLGTIDPVFWETCGIKAMGHKLLFAKGISKLT